MKVALTLASVFFLGSMSFAADAEHSNSETMDHSKNPITGTEKTVKKSKHKTKDASGETTKTVKDTTKVGKDGKVEETTETKTESESKH